MITCNINDMQILFCGLDDVEKIKSITPKKSVITFGLKRQPNVYNDIKQLDKRLRGRSKVVKRLTLSFNPILKDHWLYNNYFDIYEDGNI